MAETGAPHPQAVPPQANDLILQHFHTQVQNCAVQAAQRHSWRVSRQVRPRLRAAPATCARGDIYTVQSRYHDRADCIDACVRGAIMQAAFASFTAPWRRTHLQRRRQLRAAASGTPCSPQCLRSSTARRSLLMANPRNNMKPLRQCAGRRWSRLKCARSRPTLPHLLRLSLLLQFKSACTTDTTFGPRWTGYGSLAAFSISW
eukprot:SAG31_NODE_1183_length_9510_cov_43.257040_9_plen_203_part_00